MVKIIMELVSNNSFTLSTENRTQIRLRCHKNSVPQGLVWPIVYNIYTYNLPASVSQKYAYADYLAFMHSAGDLQVIKRILSQNIVTLAAYLQTWRLKLSWSETVSASFHLNNREASRKFNVSLDGKCLPFIQKPTYLGVKLDRSLMYHRHLESLHGKLTSHIALMRGLARS